MRCKICKKGYFYDDATQVVVDRRACAKIMPKIIRIIVSSYKRIKGINKINWLNISGGDMNALKIINIK